MVMHYHTHMKNYMTITKILLALALGLLLVACAQKGTPTHVDDAVDDFRVTKLFTKDTCTVYRFFDYGEAHYFTDCGTTISSKSKSCGKSCVRHYDEEISDGTAP